MNNYDLAVIGAGWAGFNAAVKAAKSGLKVCLIEKDQLGGTCLNRGCIPTKALIQSAKALSLIKKSSVFGIHCDNPSANFSEIQKRKAQIITQLKSGMQFTLKNNKNINFVQAEAKIISSGQLSVGSEKINAKNILIASGSSPLELPDLKFDAKKILSSDDILNIKEVPKSLLIIGGGVVGCEFAGLFSVLGSNVTIIEMLPRLLPQEDKEVAKKLETIFKKRGIKVMTGSDARTVNFDNYELVLLAVGRRPNTAGLSEAGIRLEKNRIAVDDYLAAAMPNTYAAGDCVGSIMLAHYAAYQGELVADNLVSAEKRKTDSSAIPNCIFTDPEVASVGLNAEKAQQAGIEIKVSRFDFLASGMARILGETDGFIKIISHKQNGDILGASIIGPKATELIGILALGIKSRLKLSQLKNTVFAHPTLSECIGEALKSSDAI